MVQFVLVVEREGPSRGLLRDYEPSDGTFSSTSLYFSIFSKDLILYSNFAPDIGIMVLPPLVGRHQRGVSSAYRMRLCLISSQSRLINDLAAADNKQGFTGEIN